MIKNDIHMKFFQPSEPESNQSLSMQQGIEYLTHKRGKYIQIGFNFKSFYSSQVYLSKYVLLMHLLPLCNRVYVNITFLPALVILYL